VAIDGATEESNMASPGKLRVGTSGYAYKEWKGSFYPEKFPDKEMLKYYSERFSTVEINYTFYRLPKESLLQQWAQTVPESFRFALKANQKITHIQRLRNCEEILKRFLEIASVLQEGDHLGPILVQLPPNFKFDKALLEDFLSLRPTAFSFAFEARHPSWYTDETYDLLRRHNTALCLAETEKETPLEVLTANFTYARLRQEDYTPKQIKEWRTRFEGWMAQGIDVNVFFKHEDSGTAPKYAQMLLGKK
jgi:uncharacterized protein YecE (DUF72 family)